MNPRRIALAVLALGVLAFAIERLVVTDREAVTALLEEATAAVSKSDWEGLSRTLDEEYSERGRDRAAFVSYVAGLAKHDGNVRAFARDSGIARNYLHRLLRRNGIRRVHVDT